MAITKMNQQCRQDAMQKECDEFNSRYSVGHPVRFWKGAREGAGRVGAVRHPAQVLGDHTPVVYIDGGAGAIALTHVQPMGAEEEAVPA